MAPLASTHPLWYNPAATKPGAALFFARGGAEGKGLYHHVLCGYDADHTFFLFPYAAKLPPAIITFIIAYAASRVVLKVADKLFARSRMEKTIEKFLRSACAS